MVCFCGEMSVRYSKYPFIWIGYLLFDARIHQCYLVSVLAQVWQCLSLLKYSVYSIDHPAHRPTGSLC